jgi:hypothetical protein
LPPLSTVPIAIIDTNIVMTLPRIHEHDWKLPLVDVYILRGVTNELDGLARDRTDADKARRAQRARDILSTLQKRAPSTGLLLRDGRVRLFFADAPQQICAPLQADSVDHQQIAFAHQCMREDPTRFCAIVTQDREMSGIAASACPPVQVVTSENADWNRLLSQFLRKYEWWKQWTRVEQAAPPSAEAGQSIKPPRPARPTLPNPEVRLQRIARNFHRRLGAAHYRAILAIAPLQARLALTAHLLNVLKRAPRRVLLVFVETRAEADYWARELRARCELPPGAVFVFRETGLTRGETPRAIVYHYDQIESFFNQHAARLKSSDRILSVVVDGCDLLSPERLAILLFGADQFAGYTRHALRHAHARSGLLLSHFFEQQTIFSYTFADAEADGWLRSFDTICQPIAWRAEEERAYAEINAQYIRLHDQTIRTYPALSRATNFWTALEKVLETVADAETAEIFKLREQREAMAQRAQAKLDKILSLLTRSDDESERGYNLVYDPSGRWIPILQKELPLHGLKVNTAAAETSYNDWEILWRNFDARKLDCLLLSVVPPFGLPRSHIHRLIITTPITALSTLTAAADWALSHAHSTDRYPLEIHMLHVPHTPEEQMLQDFADSVCGIRFTSS